MSDQLFYTHANFNVQCIEYLDRQHYVRGAGNSG